MPAARNSPRVTVQPLEHEVAFAHSWKKLLLVLLRFSVWCYVLFIALSFFGSPVTQFDDAIPLVHGALVQQGRVPNLDFYSIYPPLGHYLHAAMFVLFGKGIVSSRLIGAVLYIAVLCLTGALFRARFSRWSPLVPVCVLLVAVSIGASLGSPPWPGFALSLVALLSYLLAQARPRNRLPSIAVSGFLAAAAILWRINFGGYVVLVVAIDLLLRSWPEPEGRWTRDRLKPLLTTAIAYGVPLVLTCLGFCLSVYGSEIGRATWEFVVGAQKLMLLRGFITLRASPGTTRLVMLPSAFFFFRILCGRQTFPLQALLAAALAVANLLLVLACATRPSIAVIGLIMQVASVLFLHLFIQPLETAELNILLFFCCQLHYYLSRADVPHLLWLIVLAAFLLPFLLFPRQDKTSPAAESLQPRGSGYAVLVAVIVIVGSADGLRPRVSYGLNGLKLLSIRLHSPRASDSDLVFDSNPISSAWNTVYYDSDELAALRFLRSSTRHDEPVFVGVPDHSRIFYNDLRFYWLADRPIGVRTFQLETRSATEAPVQTGIIADLGRNRVRWLILDLQHLRGDDTFAEHPYQGSTLLDDYIRSHFREVARFGHFAVLNRIG
jgi:hypothetical protein